MRYLLSSQIKCISYLIFKLFCPLSIGRNGGEVVGTIIVILVQCMKRVAAVKREKGRMEMNRKIHSGRKVEIWVLAGRLLLLLLSFTTLLKLQISK